LNFLAARPDPGTFILDFSVTTSNPEYLQIESAKRKVIVVVKAEVSDCEVAVSDSSDFSDISKTSVSYGKELKSPIKIIHNQFLYISFKVKNAGSSSARPLLVHQAVLKLTHIETKEDYYFVGKASNSRVYSVIVDFSYHKDLFANNSGDYEINLIIGDSYIDTSFVWKIGKANILFDGTERRGNKDPFAKKPEISHKFKKAETQAEWTTTQVFSALVLSPLLYLFLSVIRYSNFNNYPSGLTSLYGLAFIVSIALLSGLHVYYWFKLRFLEALYYLVLIGIVAMFSGNKVLNYLLKNRKIKRD